MTLRYILYLFVLLLTTEVYSQQDCSISSTEEQVLIDLYNSTSGDNWLNSWDLNTPACDWDGVVIENATVISLNLSGRNLNGYLPESLSQLSSLKVLNLSSNNIQNPIPVSIQTLTQLEELNLSNNNFSGPIPQQIVNLTGLKILDLSLNSFSGNLPEDITQLSSLQRLLLNDNGLGGIIPSNIGQLGNLEVLNIQSNSFNGEFPEAILSLNNLRSLNLGGNAFIGTIPTTIDNLSSIENLYLNDNSFIGTIPLNIQNLGSLKILHLNGNSLSGTIPSDLGNISGLQDLKLNSNDLTGKIPVSFGDLSNLSSLNVSNNRLNGKVPRSLSSLSTLINLNISQNEFIFSDMEADYTYFSNNLNEYYYSPQAKADVTDTIQVVVGGTLELGTELFSVNNSYQWYHNNSPLQLINRNNKLTIQNIASSDAGEYYFSATNSLIQGLSIVRNPIYVEVVEQPLPEDCIDCYSFKPAPGKKYVIGAWVKEDQPSQVPTYSKAGIEVSFLDASKSIIESHFFIPSGDIIDEWQRIYAEFIIPSNTFSIQLSLLNNSSVPAFYDDIRIHPFNGSMKSFVYDPNTQRLMAELDENNYSTFYEYDNEGSLIRTKKETQRGVYTIQEARSKKSIQ